MLLLVLLTVHLLLLLLLLHLELLLHSELLVHLLLLSRINHLHWLTHHVRVHLLHRLLLHDGLLLLSAIHFVRRFLLRHLLLIGRLFHRGRWLFSGSFFSCGGLRRGRRLFSGRGIGWRLIFSCVLLLFGHFRFEFACLI
jgi:hypothetical protein